MTPLRAWGAERIAEAWNTQASPKYRIGPDLIGQNLLDHPLFDEAASFAEDDSFVAIKRSAASLYPGPDPQTAHLSLFAGRPTHLLSRAVDVLRDKGIEELVLGTDSGHFLPGAPADLPWLAEWLEWEGFLPGGSAVDLERDLSDYRAEPVAQGAEYRTLANRDVAEVERFLRREFPGRWHYDVMRKIEAEGATTIFGLFVDGACEGFALLQQEGCRLPIGGAVWKADLGPDWGALGPIGVAKAVRGKGYGNSLLMTSLSQLSQRGTRRTIIDWTGIPGFYEAQGFTVARTYRSYRLTLRVDRPTGA